MITSQARIDANRRNAKLSTGPKTKEGKDRSRYNALKHGASAVTPVIPGEDAQEYERRIHDWIREFQPATPAEHALVDRAARLSWQLDRVDRAHLNHLLANPELVSEAITDEPDPPPSPDIASGDETILRYQIIVHRDLFETMNALMKMKLRRASSSPAQPVQ